MNQKEQILELLRERRREFLDDYNKSDNDSKTNFLIGRITELDSIIGLIQTSVKDEI